MKCGNCNKECRHYQSIATPTITKRYYKCTSCHTIMIQTLQQTSKQPPRYDIIQTTTHTPQIRRPQTTLDNYLQGG